MRLLHGGRQEAVIEVVVDTGDLVVSVLPSRGMNIWWATYRHKRMFWESPVREAVHPMYVNLEYNGMLGWLDGFCEGVARCGLAYTGEPGVDTIVDDRGNRVEVSLPLHGRIANTPASEITLASASEGGRSFIVLTGVCYECAAQFDKYRLVSRLTIPIGGNEMAVHDEVTNLSSERVSPLELLYHINVGGDALEDGSRMVFRGKVTSRDARAEEDFADHARFSTPQKCFIEQCYFIDLAESAGGRCGAMVVNANNDFAVYETHRRDQLKCFTEWKQLGLDEYVVGLEPGTSLPRPRGVEREAGRLEFLDPQETRVFDLSIGAVEGTAAVAETADRLG